NIVTRAVASAQASPACLSLKGTSGTDLTLKGTVDVSMPGCTITVFSTDSSSVLVQGNSQINAFTLDTAGGISGGGSLNLTVGATTDKTPTVTDPYATVTIPSIPSIPTSVKTAPSLPTAPTAPSSQSVNTPSAP